MLAGEENTPQPKRVCTGDSPICECCVAASEAAAEQASRITALEERLRVMREKDDRRVADLLATGNRLRDELKRTLADRDSEEGLAQAASKLGDFVGSGFSRIRELQQSAASL